MHEGAERAEKLQEVVRQAPTFQAAKQNDALLTLPTGDGMALVFFGDPIIAVRCAMEISRVLRNHPELELRMGVHSGPVYRVGDIHEANNVAGGGINTAQRVMDCGDAGHILLSQSVADVLRQVGGWERYVEDLAEFTVKHGQKLHLFNLHGDDFGNPKPPARRQGGSIEDSRKVLLDALSDTPQFETASSRRTLVRDALRGHPTSDETFKALRWLEWEGGSLVVADNLLNLLDGHEPAPGVSAWGLVAQAIEPLVGAEHRQKLV